MNIDFSSPWTIAATAVISFAAGAAANRYAFPGKKKENPFKRARKAASSKEAKEQKAREEDTQPEQ